MARALIQLWEGILVAFTSLNANKLRAGLTTLGIIIGVSTIITILTIIDGLDRAFSNQISSLGSDNLYVTKMPWVMGMDFYRYRNRKDVTLREYEAVRDQATLLAGVTPVVNTRAAMAYGNRKMQKVMVIGTDEAYQDVAGAYPEFGRFMTAIEAANKRQVCLLGRAVADELFQDDDPLDKKVFVGGHPYYVIGVLEKRGEIFGQNLDTNVLLPLGAFHRMFGSRRSLTIQVKVADTGVIDAAKDELRGILRRARRVAPEDDDDFAINQQDTLMNLYNNLTSGLYMVATGIAAISLLVGGIGIMNIMLVAVTERTREIGIRKAIGARRRDVLWQFLVEAVVISGVGGIIGIGLGFVFGQIIDTISPLPAQVTPLSVAIGLGFSSAVGIFFGFYPANKAARLDPIEALRYE